MVLSQIWRITQRKHSVSLWRIMLKWCLYVNFHTLSSSKTWRGTRANWQAQGQVPVQSLGSSQIQKGKSNLTSGLTLKSHGATHPTHKPTHPTTFRGSEWDNMVQIEALSKGEGVQSQCGKWREEHRVVHHVQGENYQRHFLWGQGQIILIHQTFTIIYSKVNYYINHKSVYKNRERCTFLNHS